MGGRSKCFYLVTISKQSRSVLILFETGKLKLYAHFRLWNKLIGRMGASEYRFSRRSSNEWIIFIFAPSISDKICNILILSMKMRWFYSHSYWFSHSWTGPFMFLFLGNGLLVLVKGQRFYITINIQMKFLMLYVPYYPKVLNVNPFQLSPTNYCD